MKRIKFGLAIVAICFASVQVQAQVKVKSAPKKIYLSCNTEDPMPSIAIDTTKTNRGMADNNFLWDNGKVLVVKLLSGSKTLKDKVKKYASEWEKYANIKFKFVETGDAQIRVYLGDKQGDFGHVTMGLGIRCLERSASDFTMHFDTTDLTEEASLKGTVLHEFGHALGLMHEHFYPKSAIQWDSAAVYTRKRMSGWSKAMTDAQIFRKFNSSYTNGTQYDPKSIMHYPVSPWETKNRYSVGHNTELSEGDKALIAALYPKGIRKHEVPRVTITNVGTTLAESNAARGGLCVYPSFTISCAGKSASVNYEAYLLNEDDEFLASSSKFYSINGAAGTAKQIVLPIGKTYTLNKVKKNFEIFIPFEELPRNALNKKIKVFFRVVLVTDEEQKQLNTYNVSNMVTVAKEIQ